MKRRVLIPPGKTLEQHLADAPRATIANTLRVDVAIDLAWHKRFRVLCERWGIETKHLPHDTQALALMFGVPADRVASRQFTYAEIELLAQGKAPTEQTISGAEFSKISTLSKGHVSRLAKKPGFALTRENAERMKRVKRPAPDKRAAPKQKPKTWMCKGCSDVAFTRGNEQPRCNHCGISPGFELL